MLFFLVLKEFIVDLIKRELNSLQGNVHFIHLSKSKPVIRTLMWSKALSSKQNENVENDSKAADESKQTKMQKEEKTVLKIVTPNVKEQEIKASDVRVVLENVKEQSLNKEATAADALKQIKEKIFDIKSKETEQEKGN